MSVTDGRRRARLLAAVFSLLLAALAWTWLRHREAGPAAPTSAPIDLSRYAAYPFGDTGRVIDVGIQPLYLPAGILTEALRRDAVLRGQLAERGLEIRFHEVLKGADLSALLGQGSLDAGVAGDVPSMLAAARHGASLVALAQQGFCAVVAGRPMLLHELAGRRVGLAYGSNAHFMLLAALADAGLRPTDIVPVYLDVTALPRALAEGRIDAFAAWEPTTSSALKEHPGQTVIHRGLASGYLILAPGLRESRREAGLLLLAAQERAFRWLRADARHLRLACGWAIDAGQRLGGADLRLDADDYARLAGHDLLDRSGTCAIPAADRDPGGRLARLHGLLREAGMIPAGSTWADMVARLDASAMEAVLADAAGYRLAEVAYDAGDPPRKTGTDNGKGRR